jgi:hypothetical protein
MEKNKRVINRHIIQVITMGIIGMRLGPMAEGIGISRASPFRAAQP